MTSKYASLDKDGAMVEVSGIRYARSTRDIDIAYQTAGRTSSAGPPPAPPPLDRVLATVL